MNDDKMLLRRIQQRDKEALTMLMSRYEDVALRAAYLITQDTDIAADVVQTLFLKVYRHPQPFIAAKNFRAYFLHAVSNAARDSFRGRETSASDNQAYEQLIDLLESTDPGPQSLTEQNERREMVQMALSQLTAQQRMVIVQRYYLGLSVREMAVHNAIPEGTIKSRLAEARRRLRGFLSHLSLEGVSVDDKR